MPFCRQWVDLKLKMHWTNLRIATFLDVQSVKCWVCWAEVSDHGCWNTESLKPDMSKDVSLQLLQCDSN